MKEIMQDVKNRRDIVGGLFLLVFAALTSYAVVMELESGQLMTGTLIAIAMLIAKRWFDGSPSSERKTELLAHAPPIKMPGEKE